MCFLPSDMDFLTLIQSNEEKNRWLYPYWMYDPSTDTWTFTALDSETHTYFSTSEYQLQKECPFCRQPMTSKFQLQDHILKTHPQTFPSKEEVNDWIDMELERRTNDKMLEVFETNCMQNINIVGYVQGGKSFIIMLLLWKILYQKKMIPILCVTNMINSYNQIISRDIPYFNKWLREKGEYKRQLTIQNHFQKEGILLTLGNSHQLKKIKRMKNYCMIVDESDTFIKHWNPKEDKSSLSKVFAHLIQHSQKNVWVTATPFANWNQSYWQSITIQMKPSENYRGIQSKQWTIHTFSIEEKQKLLKDNTSLVDLILEAISHCDVRTTRRYSVLLVNARYSQRDQKKIASLLQRKGQSCFVINSEHVKPITHYHENGEKGEKGQIEIMSMKTVQDLFDFFETSSCGYQCHVLISNRMANRAISFRPSYPYTGGLIGEILIPNKSSHCSNLIQSLRICGNYDSEYPQQHLWICEKDWSTIQCESINIYNIWSSETQFYGSSRTQLEKIPFFVTGKHDRKQVDDSKSIQKKSLCDVSFESIDTLWQCVSSHYENYRVMTESKRYTFSLSSNQNIKNPTQQYEIREWIKKEFEQRYQIYIGNQGFNIAWEYQGNRWKQLHDMSMRFFSDNIRYCSKFVGSINETGTEIHIIIWKTGFYEDDRTMSRTLGNVFQGEKTIYLYLTTENQWKYFHPKETRKLGIFVH